jgi:hypothetical protein
MQFPLYGDVAENTLHLHSKICRLVFSREINFVYFKNYTEPIDTLCRQNQITLMLVHIIITIPDLGAEAPDCHQKL